jgi:NitT/TauT family transport system ATP-binding protein
VMSQRPGRIIEEIAVDVADRDNPMKRRQHPRIAEYVVRLMGLLQIEQAAA